MLLDPNRSADAAPGADNGADQTARAPADAADDAALDSPAPAAGAPATLADRLARGVAANAIYTDEVIPFTEGWGKSEMWIALAGPVGAEIAARKNDGWRLTFYHYRAEDGRVVFVVLRLDDPTGARAKFVRPLKVKRMIGPRADVVVGALAVPRPLYGLDRLAANPAAPVLMVEGEKAADAGCALFPDHVTMSWPGGADGVGSTDLRPLAGRDVVIWPDHDAAGAGAALTLARALTLAGAASVRVVRVPATFPPKWDIADPLPSSAHA